MKGGREKTKKEREGGGEERRARDSMKGREDNW